MYFPVANIEVHPLILPSVAFIISLFTSMGGVSGAFLLLPFQVSVLGFNTPSVSPTNQLFNIIAIPSGIYRYFKEGRMVWLLAWVIIIGTLPGVLIGTLIRIHYLPDPRNFKIFAGLVLLYIGGRLLRDLIVRRGETNKTSAEEQFQKLIKQNKTKQGLDKQLPKAVVKKFNLSRIVYEFYGQKFDISTLGIMTLSFIVGIIGGIYGIGGGAIIAPFLVSFFRLPVYTVAGTALMGTLVTSVAGVLFYQCLAPFYPGLNVAPDLALGFLLGIGGFAGIYCGARLQKYVPAKIIKWILASCTLFIAGQYVIGIL